MSVVDNTKPEEKLVLCPVYAIHDPLGDPLYWYVIGRIKTQTETTDEKSKIKSS